MSLTFREVTMKYFQDLKQDFCSPLAKFLINIIEPSKKSQHPYKGRRLCKAKLVGPTWGSS
ncbi:hypothetical protein BDV40DRAFT_266003 [Aspergillus tamarii]|uniref:Subtelomeric hrmA-associated cluster protein AFUB-079030/YDR124W-like helical bundle domain-containing protein n=1 Tax=Aspergillus tamarii TaxID=41984 RepID=A0A5N6UTZ4_ASPTM|nr:hypothetical protein BDV40DRAFT_266003 [Aspergillus tamarii]